MALVRYFHMSAPPHPRDPYPLLSMIIGSTQIHTPPHAPPRPQSTPPNRPTGCPKSHAPL